MASKEVVLHEAAFGEAQAAYNWYASRNPAAAEAFADGVVKEDFAVRRKRQIILAVPLVVIIVGFAVLTDEENGGVLLGMPVALTVPAFLVLVAGAIIFSLRNWRCPACDKYLGKGMNPRFCPKCGVALQ